MAADPQIGDTALLTALAATKGVVCLVGAGGKKTTMYALARSHPGKVLLSSTSHMYPYARDQVDQIVMLEDGESAMPDVAAYRIVAVATKSQTPKRIGGLSGQRIHDLYHDLGFDVCIIKADGARARWIKTPGPHEPLIPSFADTVIPVVSAKVVGRPLQDDIAHRPERLARFFDINLGDPILPRHVVELLSSATGALKGVGRATVVPLINMVDDDQLHQQARQIARATLARSERVSRIVLASMKHARIVEIVERDSV